MRDIMDKTEPKKSFMITSIDPKIWKAFKVRCAKEGCTMSSKIKKYIFAYAMGGGRVID